MLIILDTNCIFDHFHLQGPNFAILFSAALLSDIYNVRVAIPLVVIDEVVIHYQKQLREFQSKFNEYQRSAHRLRLDSPGRMRAKIGFGKMTGDITYDLELDNIDTMVKEYMVWLHRRMKQLEIEVLQYPQIAHQDLVARLLAGKKPFGVGDKKEIGYRDALIWATALDALEVKREPIALITNNTGDFATARQEHASLHQDLIEDLEARNLDPNLVSIYNSLKQFNEECVIPLLTDARTNQLIGGTAVARFNLDTRLVEQLHGLLLSEQPTHEQLHLSSDIEAVRIDEIQAIDSLEVTDLRTLLTGWLTGKAEANARCLVRARIHKIDWYGFDRGQRRRFQEGLEYNLENPFVDIEAEVSCHVNMSFTVDVSREDSLSAELLSLRAFGATPELSEAYQDGDDDLDLERYSEDHFSEELDEEGN